MRYASYADWYKKGPLAPFVRRSGTVGDAMTVIEASQPAGDMSDPAVNELVLIRAISNGTPINVDLGAGRFQGTRNFGDFLLVAPNTASDIQVHAAHRAEVNSLRVQSCLSLLGESDQTHLDFGQLHQAPFRSDLLTALCDRLVGTVREPHKASRLFVDAASMALLAELKLLAGHHDKQEPQAAPGDWRVRRTIEQMQAQIGEAFSLPELAAAVGLSPSRYTTLFHSATGLSPYAWLVRRRIDRASDLLRNTRLPITEIAHGLGFSSSQHFATAFRGIMAKTPTEWRRGQ